jgi:hypothetical protein
VHLVYIENIAVEACSLNAAGTWIPPEGPSALGSS